MSANQQNKSNHTAPGLIPNVNTSPNSNGPNPQYIPLTSPVFAPQSQANANQAVSNQSCLPPGSNMNPVVNQQAINPLPQPQQQQPRDIPYQSYQQNLAQQPQLQPQLQPQATANASTNNHSNVVPTVSKPSAIDDLLDLFDGSSLSSTNVLQPMSQQQKPTPESYTNSLNLSNVSNASDSIYDIIKAEDAKKSNQLIEQQEKSK